MKLSRPDIANLVQEVFKVINIANNAAFLEMQPVTSNVWDMKNLS